MASLELEYVFLTPYHLLLANVMFLKFPLSPAMNVITWSAMSGGRAGSKPTYKENMLIWNREQENACNMEKDLGADKTWLCRRSLEISLRQRTAPWHV